MSGSELEARGMSSLSLSGLLQRYYELRAMYPLRRVSHITIVPKGKSVTRREAARRLRVMMENSVNSVVLLVHEVSKAGVHHYHGFLIYGSSVPDHKLLTVLTNHGNVRGWCNYMMKDKPGELIEMHSPQLEPVKYYPVNVNSDDLRRSNVRFTSGCRPDCPFICCKGE